MVKSGMVILIEREKIDVVMIGCCMLVYECE
jgi:hypothetical protein